MAKSKFKEKHFLTLIIILGLEIALCGVQQFILGKPYSFYYAAITLIFATIQTLYCLNIDKFSKGRDGIRDFFIYKAAKLFIVILPLFIYVVVSDKIDVWIPIRVAVYYFAFLIIETVITAQRQKNNKKQMATKSNG